MSILSPPDPPCSNPPQGLDQGVEAAVASPSTLTAPLLVPAQKERQEENADDDEEESVEGKKEHIFDELPSAKVVDASRPESHDIGQFQLVYTIQLRYKQFHWQLVKKASQVLLLHFDLKKRALLEELHEKQEQVKQKLQNLGLGDHFHSHEDEEYCEGAHHSSSSRRDVPSSAAFPIIKPALGSLSSSSRKAISEMQDYLDRFLGSLDIVNTREVCKFLEVSKLSFRPEYGPKLREGFVRVKHLQTIIRQKEDKSCFCSSIICWCNDNWQKVWAVLKPGFLAFIADPYDTKLLDIIVFDVLPSDAGNPDGQIYLAKLAKERNPLRFGFVVTCGRRTIRLRTKQSGNAYDWVTAINHAGLGPSEGWCRPHRYGSFAPPRGDQDDASEAQWFIDGKAAYHAIASAIEHAKSEVFITGWWLCPELYMRRPFAENEESRLDTLLRKRAEMGVKIYILLYKEVALALKINSFYSKRILLSIHENIKVLRFPNHLAAGVFLWSHHEKIVIVDNRVAFLGGLDLCFGRYDNQEHKVHDSSCRIWPGKDYYNPRESEPNCWEDTMKDQLDRHRYPRMPWHDVHCALWGPACRDIARHFVQRWNYAKRSKAAKEPGIPLLFPYHQMVLPGYHSMNMPVVIEVTQDKQEELIASAKSSYYDTPLLFPQEDKQIGAESQSYEANSTGTQDSKDSHSPMNNIYHTKANNPRETWWESMESQGQASSEDEAREIGPRVKCACQILRSVGFWSAGSSRTEEKSIHTAYCSLISKAEHYVYIENQFFISGFDDDDVIGNRVLQALYDRIMLAHKEGKCFRVIVIIPLFPGFQGGVDDAGAATVRAIMHWQYRTICRGKHSLLQRLSNAIGSDTENYVSFYGLRNYGKLSDGGPLVTNQVYVHSKIMIIDDRTVLMGSPNLNDRSLLGSRDSEIAVVIEDKEFVDSYMDSKPWKAGKFAHSMRVSLWREHLGLQHSEVNLLVDPVCDTSYKQIWMATAQMNTRIYDTVFGCIPNETIRSRTALRQAYIEERMRGHMTIDLGMAIKENPTKSNGVSGMSVDGIRGFLVMFPLRFLEEDDLRPIFSETEFYAGPQVFH